MTSEIEQANEDRGSHYSSTNILQANVKRPRMFHVLLQKKVLQFSISLTCIPKRKVKYGKENFVSLLKNKHPLKLLTDSFTAEIDRTF